MSPLVDKQRFGRLQSLFHEAADLPRNQQHTFVEAACSGDTSLMADVLVMLEEDNEGESLLSADLAQMAHQVLGPHASALHQMREFGPYCLQRILGEGGMGVVYLARRGDLGNLVAVKFLRDPWLSPARRERFAIEQRTLSQLSHPCIARLYDAGISGNGIPWFVMEYVDGIPIIEYCRRSVASARKRLEIFRQVCTAVQYAHEHAIIHRDLKPSNMLVKADGSVRLLDFGIAKQLEAVDQPMNQTHTEARLMTPAYAAPEQIRGEAVGLYTDVYALGVVLYELLTGTRPGKVKEGTASRSSDSTVSAPTEKPSAVVRRGAAAELLDLEASKRTWADLDVITLTALQPEVSRRYRSVEALIRDIDHHLNGEPIEMRADSVTYRLGKFVRRNGRSLSIAAMVAACMALMAIFFTVRLAAARNVAVAAAQRTKRVQTFMLNLFEGGDKSGAPAENLSILTVLDRGVQEAQTFNRDPELRADLYETLGTVYEKLGRMDRADQLLHSAFQQRSNFLGPDDPETAQALIELGLLRVDGAKFQEGEQFIRTALDKLKRSRTTNPEHLAKATLALGKVLEERGNYGAAIPVLDQAIQLESEARAPGAELASGIKELADAEFYSGHYSRCESLTRRALDMHRAMFGDANPAVAEDLINLGAVQSEYGHYGKAEQFERKALDIDRKWYGETHPRTGSDLFMLGKELVAEGRLEDAERLLQQARTIQQHVYGSNHPHVANILNEECLVASARNQLPEAERCFTQVIDIYRKAYGNQHYLVGLALANLGSAYLDEKEYSSAEQSFREAIALYGRVLPAGHLYLGIVDVKLGRTLRHQKRLPEAESYSLAGYDILMKQPTPPASWLKAARKDLVEIYEGLGQPEKAAKFRAELAQATKAAS